MGHGARQSPSISLGGEEEDKTKDYFFFNQPFPLTIAIYFLYGFTYYVHSERYVKILTCGMHGCDLIWK